MAQIKAWAKKNRLALALAAFAAAYFLFSYFSQLPRPGAMADPKASWSYWFDQGQYLKEAKAIRIGNLDKTQYTYPFGYPMIGSIFVSFMPNDPFLIFNLAVFVFTIVMFFITLSRLFGKNWALFGTGGLLLATPLVYFTVIPWTTTATLPAVLYTMYLAFAKDNLTFQDSIIVSLLYVLAFMARVGGEVLLLSPLLLAIGWKFKKSPKFWQKVALAGLIVLAGFGLNALWTRAIFGTWVHPYVKIVQNIGFSLRKVPRSFWGTMIFSGRAGGYTPTLLGSAFWFILAPVGMVIALLKMKDWYLHAGMILSMALGSIVTNSYKDYGPQTLKFNSLHYSKIWFPALALYVVLALAYIIRDFG